MVGWVGIGRPNWALGVPTWWVGWCRDAQFGRLSPFTDYHNHLLFSDLTAFNRNRFNNNRANWLVDYNTKYPTFPPLRRHSRPSAVIPAPPLSFPPLRRHSRPSAVIPAPPPSFPPLRCHSRPSAVIPAPPPTFPHSSAVIPAPPPSFLPLPLSFLPLRCHSCPPLSFPQYLSGNPYWIMPTLIRLTQTGFPLKSMPLQVVSRGLPLQAVSRGLRE